MIQILFENFDNYTINMIIEKINMEIEKHIYNCDKIYTVTESIHLCDIIISQLCSQNQISYIQTALYQFELHGYLVKDIENCNIIKLYLPFSKYDIVVCNSFADNIQPYNINKVLEVFYGNELKRIKLIDNISDDSEYRINREIMFACTYINAHIKLYMDKHQIKEIRRKYNYDEAGFSIRELYVSCGYIVKLMNYEVIISLTDFNPVAIGQTINYYNIIPAITVCKHNIMMSYMTTIDRHLKTNTEFSINMNKEYADMMMLKYNDRINIIKYMNGVFSIRRPLRVLPYANANVNANASKHSIIKNSYYYRNIK